MSNFLEKVSASIMPIVGMLLFVAVLIVAIIFLSYVFIVIAVVGFVLFAIGYIRARFLMHKYAKNQSKKPKGRTIDHK